MIINEIADYVRFLRKEGYNIYIALSEEFSEETRKALSDFLPDEKATDKTVMRSVFYDDIEIAKISADEEEYLSALSVPLKYMIERLYEESLKQISDTNEHDIYRKALQYIKEHYTEGITVADVSKHINYSESYFGYAFKKKYKMTVSQYVRELQLAKSKDLLENTSFSVASVASYVGFDDFNYFSALFKKHFGLSPKEYRKQHSTLI
ncbi:MAG: helix-turn-helix transcriptional regulator [Clostridia bacterium]|nr:helix-turn-helix transcriptional regulator [Clostridia bacterium]